MTNEQVMKAFLEKKRANSSNKNLRSYPRTPDYEYESNGAQAWLVNYNTRIAYFDETDTLHLNIRKYSSTTSKIQGKLVALANDAGYSAEFDNLKVYIGSRG